MTKSNPTLPLIPASTYNTADYLRKLPDLAQNMMIVEYPAPFTMRDYRKWIRAASTTKVPKEYDGEEETAAFYKQLVGALAVAKVTPYVQSVIDDLNAQQTAVKPSDEDDEFCLPVAQYTQAYAAVDPHILKLENIKDLPVAVRAFLVDTADLYIGPKMIVEHLAGVRNRRRKQQAEALNSVPGFQHDHLFGDVLPDMAAYRGFVIYEPAVTTASYGAWTAAVRKKPVKNPPNDVDNTPFLRQLRGVGAMLKDFKFKYIADDTLLNWKALKSNDFDDMPLELASFLVDTLDEYLGRSSTLKN